MAQTVANFADVMKEVWTQDRLEKQFYDENPFLDRLEKTNRYTIGKQAQVPIHKSRSGGYTVHSPAGGALNPADQQGVDQAFYTLSQPAQRVALEFGVLNQGAGGATSVGSALNLEVEGAVADLRKQAMRQAVSNGDALIAECTTTAASTTVNLSPTGYGYDAIVRGWLYPGLTIDIGTAAAETSVAADRKIISVKEDPLDPEIVISGAAVTTAAGDFISIANARAGAVSNETNGLRTIVGSNTSAIGGLDPDNAGEAFWKPAYVDSTTTVLSTNLLLTLQAKVYQKVGKFNTYVLMGIKQASVLYELLQNQARFVSEPDKVGGVMGVEWNGMTINTMPDVPDREVYMLTIEDFLICTGKYSKPTFYSDVMGINTGLQWNLGNTDFQDAVTYAHQIAIKRRNSHACAIGLTA